MKCKILLLTSLLFLTFLNERIIGQILFPIDEVVIGVKHKTSYPSLESNQVSSIEDFEYNSKGQLQKKIYYGGKREILYHYELFNYGNDGKLIFKLNYHSSKNSPSGFILLDSTAYTYAGKLFASEMKIYPLAGYYEKFIFEYDDEHLLMKTKYHNEDLEEYFVYEYDEARISKEIHFSKDRVPGSYKKYLYNDVALNEIVIYSPKDEAKRRINYFYNENGKLDIEKVDELSIVSSTKSHVIRYEY
jgi:hypothetical protein